MAIGKREVEGTPVCFLTSSAQKRDRLPLLMLHRLDGRGAGAGVQLGIWEEEMSLVTRYPILLQQVRMTTCLIGWGMGKGKDAQDLQEISPEWERTGPGAWVGEAGLDSSTLADVWQGGSFWYTLMGQGQWEIYPKFHKRRGCEESVSDAFMYCTY